MCEYAFNKIERDLRAEDGTALNFMARITLWSSGRLSLRKWTAPRSNGDPDHNAACNGDDLIEYVDRKLFPYFAAFPSSASKYLFSSRHAVSVCLASCNCTPSGFKETLNVRPWEGF